MTFAGGSSVDNSLDHQAAIINTSSDLPQDPFGNEPERYQTITDDAAKVEFDPNKSTMSSGSASAKPAMNFIQRNKMLAA